MIRTLLVALLFSLSVILVLPFFILWSAITGNPDLMYRVAMSVVRFANRVAGIQVHVEGIGNIPQCACVFAANHVSNADALAFIPAIPRRVVILVKHDLFRIPIFSAAMRQAQFISVNRADREAAISSIETATQRLKQGLSFAIFPEGTRSPDGRLRRFKTGAFAVAIDAGVPIIPVAIAGTQLLMKKGDWILRPGTAVVRFGPAVDAGTYAPNRRMELLARVEALVATALPPEQQPLSPSSGAASAPSE